MSRLFQEIFTEEKLKELFPSDRSNSFFEALYGDADEGAYEIALIFQEATESRLAFAFHLRQRPGKCLACNLTYGLPQVFSRHPVIDLNGLAQRVGSLLDGHGEVEKWEIGKTQEVSPVLHIIPFVIHLHP